MEKEMATYSSVLAWRILWTEEPGGLLSMGSHRIRHDWSDFACIRVLEKEMATHSSVLAWRIPGTGEPGGLPSMGSHRVGHDWSNLAAAAQVKDQNWTQRITNCQLIKDAKWSYQGRYVTNYVERYSSKCYPRQLTRDITNTWNVC